MNVRHPKQNQTPECYRITGSSSRSYTQLSSANAATFARRLALTASSNSAMISFEWLSYYG
jgi:hypothetical protein